MPVEPPEEGKIVHPTFQITAFSTSLKNHVMVMDLVKRDWLPSQRRAKVCFIHTCQGLKVAERQVSRYEVQLGLRRVGGEGRCTRSSVIPMEVCVGDPMATCLFWSCKNNNWFVSWKILCKILPLIYFSFFFQYVGGDNMLAKCD